MFIAPLDWGLGHATRCIQLINILIEEGAKVIIGADGRPYELLKKEFPALEFVRFPGVQVEYDAKGRLASRIILQLFSILRGFRKEHDQLQKIIAEKEIDVVISDSRHGVYSKSVPSIFVVNQIRLLLPPHLRWGERLVAFVHKQLMNRFTECWIPDVEGNENFSGLLTHDVPLPNNSHYIGLISRMKILPPAEKKHDVLVILSGPEPQRTMLEKILLDQLKETNLSSLIVRGMSERNETVQYGQHIRIVSSMNTDSLLEAIASSETIICRSGYSTIMDFAALGIKAIFIPTPGQTEQEYLAELLKERGLCYSTDQNRFDLQSAIKESQKYTGFTPVKPDYSLLRNRIRHYLGRK